MSVMTWLSGRRAKRWSNPSGMIAPVLAQCPVQDERLPDGEDVVDAQQGGAAVDRSKAGGDGASEALVGAGAAPSRALGNLGDERFAAGAHQNGRSGGAELVEPFHELERVRLAFHVSEPRVEHDLAGIEPRMDRAIARSRPLSQHVRDHVFV